MKIKLAEALLRRKELQEKVDQIRDINIRDLYETKVRRMKVTDSVDDVTATVPKLTLSQVTQEYDFYAKALRHVDAAIQQCNWVTDLDVPAESMADYQIPEKEAA